MSYESVVLHGRDHGAAMVVLPFPRLRTIYTQVLRAIEESSECRPAFHLLYKPPCASPYRAKDYPECILVVEEFIDSTLHDSLLLEILLLEMARSLSLSLSHKPSIITMSIFSLGITVRGRSLERTYLARRYQFH